MKAGSSTFINKHYFLKTKSQMKRKFLVKVDPLFMLEWFKESTLFGKCNERVGGRVFFYRMPSKSVDSLIWIQRIHTFSGILHNILDTYLAIKLYIIYWRQYLMTTFYKCVLRWGGINEWIGLRFHSVRHPAEVFPLYASVYHCMII